MDHFSVDKALKSLTVIVDTREQPTERAKRRLETIGLPYERKFLPFGDYSAYCILPDGGVYSLEDKVSIERKMDLGEISKNYTRGRARFIAEFKRAEAAGAKIYLLIENADWEKAYSGTYRSRLHPNALTANLLAWLARYNCQIIMCKEETSGKLIHDILHREMKEHLEGLPDE